MQINPIGNNNISFPYKNNNNSKKVIKKETDMVYEPKENALFPFKLKAIVIIPKSEVEEMTEGKDGATN